MKKLFVCLVVCSLFTEDSAKAAATSKVSGSVIADPEITYGTAGTVNRIDLQVFDSEHSNSTWKLTCRRSSSTLGWCSGIVKGDSVVAEGYFTIAPTNQAEVTYLGKKNPILPINVLDNKAEYKASGLVIGSSWTYGYAGSLNSIELLVDPEPENASPHVLKTVTCRRSHQTLGWCYPVEPGDFIVATSSGITSSGSYEPVTYIEVKP